LGKFKVNCVKAARITTYHKFVSNPTVSANPVKLIIGSRGSEIYLKFFVIKQTASTSRRGRTSSMPFRFWLSYANSRDPSVTVRPFCQTIKIWLKHFPWQNETIQNNILLKWYKRTCKPTKYLIIRSSDKMYYIMLFKILLCNDIS